MATGDGPAVPVLRGEGGAAVTDLRARRQRDTYRCQFCEEESLARDWEDNKCPRCGRAYDAILAQEGDD